MKPSFALGLVAAAVFSWSNASPAASQLIGAAPEFPASFDLVLTHPPGSFSDDFLFSLAQRKTVSNLAVSQNLRFASGVGFNVSALTIAIYGGDNSVLGVANGVGSPQETLLELVLPVGNYRAVVSGLADGPGSGGGKYTYSLAAYTPTLDISPIPEPNPVWLMPLALLAAVWNARRRA